MRAKHDFHRVHTVACREPGCAEGKRGRERVVADVSKDWESQRLNQRRYAARALHTHRSGVKHDFYACDAVASWAPGCAAESAGLGARSRACCKDLESQLLGERGRASSSYILIAPVQHSTQHCVAQVRCGRQSINGARVPCTKGASSQHVDQWIRG